MPRRSAASVLRMTALVSKICQRDEGEGLGLISPSTVATVLALWPLRQLHPEGRRIHSWGTKKEVEFQLLKPTETI